MSPQLKHIVLLVSLCTIVFMTNLGGPKLWDRDEPRNAGCAYEMMAAGDWVVPRFNDQLRSHKPALLYWMMIASYSAFGVNEFAARFGSAILGSLTVLLTYGIGSRLFGRTSSIWGGVVLATTMMYVIASRAATPDAPLIFFVALGMWLYVRFSFPPLTEADASTAESHSYYPTSWWQVGLIYIAFGFAVLSKGPIGLILPTAIIGMFLLIMRLPPMGPITSWSQRIVWWVRPFAPWHFVKTVFFMRPVLAVVACLLVALPWYFSVAQRDYRWIEGFFWDHNILRAVSAFEGHSGPPFYYLLAICIGFFPWSVFLAPMIMDLRSQLRADRVQNIGIAFCLCWVLVWLIAFSFAQTKLPSYITPLYPALAILFGHFAARMSEKVSDISPKWLDLAYGVTVVVGVLLIVGITIASQTLVPGDEIVSTIGVIALLGGATAWGLWHCQYQKVSLQAFALMSVVFCVGLFSWAAQRVSERQNIDELIAVIEERAPDAKLHSFGALEDSWVFYAKKPISFLAENHEVLQERLSNEKSAVLFTTSEELESLPWSLRENLVELDRRPYFLKKVDLVILRSNFDQHRVAEKDQPAANNR